MRRKAARKSETRRGWTTRIIGYLPFYPEMRASFFAMGEGVARGRDLGVIDMRQIAPTVAGILGVSLPTAKEPALNLAH